MATEEQILDRIKRYRCLPWAELMTDEELRAKAIENLNKKKEEFTEELEEIEFSTWFTDKKELETANKLKAKYLEDFNIETESEKNTLMQLISLEILHKRITEVINTAFDKGNKSGVVSKIPSQIISTMHANIREITNLKNQLGLRKDEDKSNILNNWDLLKKKANDWANENVAERTRVCPHCASIIHFRMRMDKYDAVLHPNFKGRVLTNDKLIALFKEGRITKEEFGEIMGTSSEYTEWLIEKFYQ